MLVVFSLRDSQAEKGSALAAVLERFPGHFFCF
jgi:hypothetical protein